MKEAEAQEPINEREAALRALKAKRDFNTHLGAYVIVNAMMTVIWALSHAAAFWPAWSMLFWGVGLAFHGWNAHFNKPVSERDIDREIGN